MMKLLFDLVLQSEQNYWLWAVLMFSFKSDNADTIVYL